MTMGIQKKSNWPRRFVYLVLIAVVGGGLAVAFQPKPVAVDIETVEVGPMQVTIDAEGKTRVKHIYVVSSPVTGRKLRIPVEIGDRVEAGKTLLAAIEPSDPVFLDVRSHAEAQAAVKAAQAGQALASAELKRIEAELDFARADLVRADALVKRGTISRRALERNQLTVKTTEAAVSTAKAALRVRVFELQSARARLIDPGSLASRAANCCVQVKAPVNGQVLHIMQKSESVVAAGAALLEIGNPENLEIVVDLLSSDAVRVSVDDAVLIEGWGGIEALNGIVRRIEPTGFTKTSALGIEEQRVNVLVDFQGDAAAWQRLGHGFRVENRIVVWQASDVLRVPMSALFREGDNWAVYSVSGNKVELKPLKIDHVNGRWAEVITGLAAGDEVIAHPGDLIENGVEVVARGQ
jgi:HlyD family secretion protein